MRMCDENGVYSSQAILRKPFESGSLEVLADIYNDRPEHETIQSSGQTPYSESDTHRCFPSFPLIRRAAEVFLLMFFFPSGVSVERHVRHGRSSGPAVKHSICGRLDEVPVPRKMTSKLAECIRSLEVRRSGIGRYGGSGSSGGSGMK